MRFSSRIDRLPGYPLAKLPARKRELLARGVDVIDLGAGDADYPPPAEVIAAMQQATAQTALSKYGFQQGNPRFRQAACDWMRRRFGVTFDPITETLPLIGSKEGLSHLALAVLNQGDLAVVPEPGYQAYIGGTLLSGAEPLIYPLTPRTNYLVELGELPEEQLERVRLVYLNYPNNPTSAIAPREYLERTVQLCRERGIVLAYDNPYCDLTFDGYVAPSIFEIAGAREVAIEFFSLSKSFSMTGWRLGWAAGAPEFITALTRVKSYVDTGPWLAIQEAGAFALDHTERLIKDNIAELARRRDAGVAALREAGFTLESPKATMYLWIALPAGIRSADFTERALEDQGVVLLPGSGFGPGGEGYFRIALTVGPERLREAIARLGKVRAGMLVGAGRA
ncbi:MAG TPA: aminotransferase class I/II-fold pyridoxal phosphate-dependent enzyme [Gemmatimonadales bacterium]|nr:aminotransferase class I/II-fold pyridoxal phosphate-dependent enzyme [Gemmatimonadales bacterium]